MPTTVLSDLERRAAEVRRFRAQQQTEHSALELALSIPCPEHEAHRQQPCYPPPARGVCGHRYSRAAATARSLRGQGGSHR